MVRHVANLVSFVAFVLSSRAVSFCWKHVRLTGGPIRGTSPGRRPALRTSSSPVSLSSREVELFFFFLKSLICFVFEVDLFAKYGNLGRIMLGWLKLSTLSSGNFANLEKTLFRQHFNVCGRLFRAWFLSWIQSTLSCYGQAIKRLLDVSCWPSVAGYVIYRITIAA